jgi:hypothetical protein
MPYIRVTTPALSLPQWGQQNLEKVAQQVAGT